MTMQSSGSPPDREARINALLDGELDEQAAQELKTEAAGDAELAQAIVQAWQLSRGMEELRLERAPASLRRKLRRIPAEQEPARRAIAGLKPGWLAAAALAGIAAVTVVALRPGPLDGPAAAGPQTAALDDTERALQAQRELEVAFFYLDKAVLRAGHRMDKVLNEELSNPVKAQLSRHLPFTASSRKEENA